MAFEQYDKCALLLPMDGANNGTTFTDWSPTPKAITVVGNTKTVTAESKYYGSSGFFDGTGDYMSGSSVDVIGGAFTVGFWIRPIATTASSRLFSTGGGTAAWNSTTGIHLLVQIGSASKLSLQAWNGAAVFSVNSTSDLTTSAWQHCAVTFDGTTVRMFIGGVLEGSTTTAPVRPSTTPTWRVGSLPGEATSIYNGYMQDLVVFDDVALWTSTFTPPTRLVGEISGNITDNLGAPAIRQVVAMPRTNPSRPFHTVSDALGDYSIRVPATECSRLVLDSATVDPIFNDLVDRVIPA